MRSMSFAGGSFFQCSLIVVHQHRSEFGMRTVVDDGKSSFSRAEITQVSNTLFGDDESYVMFCMVNMGNHRNDGGNFAAFCSRCSHENADERRTCEVAGTADTVHHSCTHDMSGVYVTVDVGFDSCVHGDNAETTSDFGVVGNFLRSQNDMFFVEFDIFNEINQAFGRRSDGSTGANVQNAFFDQLQSRSWQDPPILRWQRNLRRIAKEAGLRANGLRQLHFSKRR